MDTLQIIGLTPNPDTAYLAKKRRAEREADAASTARRQRLEHELARQRYLDSHERVQRSRRHIAVYSLRPRVQRQSALLQRGLTPL